MNIISGIRSFWYRLTGQINWVKVEEERRRLDSETSEETYQRLMKEGIDG